ncbi:hypothetical protein SNE510_76400 [Streptomyces sp. NE5-10]|nr:hypothetical protein SNE510_76400 [Streptomyces sp. NE5-10]
MKEGRRAQDPYTRIFGSAHFATVFISDNEMPLKWDGWGVFLAFTLGIHVPLVTYLQANALYRFRLHVTKGSEIITFSHQWSGVACGHGDDVNPACPRGRWVTLSGRAAAENGDSP